MATQTQTNGRRITTHEAQIKTAAVEVKALTISGKQVTLSVFRQLQDEDLIDWETAQLRGVPWGKVNYFFGDCKPDHLHVVWQRGEELRRACVFPPEGNVAQRTGSLAHYERADTPWAQRAQAQKVATAWVTWGIVERIEIPGQCEHQTQTLTLTFNEGRDAVPVALRDEDIPSLSGAVRPCAVRAAQISQPLPPRRLHTALP